MYMDMRILKGNTGLVLFELPENAASGSLKLLQQVIALLFSDDGEFVEYIGGRANSSSISEALLSRESSRILDTVQENTPENASDDERLGSLLFDKLDVSGTRVNIMITVTSVSQNTESAVVLI